jgi:hypothetical protein
VAIELGNEINGARAMAFPAGVDPTSAYVRIAATAHATLGGTPALLGGSTNMVGTGFLRPLFAAGLLDQVDGLAVHPYRNRGEALDLEMARLNAAMDEAGKRVPVWATEFGLATTDQTTAAGELIKQATLLSASGVAQASWYALIDQAGFPTMGLFTGTALKDQGRAFRFVQDSVLGKGRATRIDMGDPLLFAYRFGTDTTVIWGAPRGLMLGKGTRAYGPTGLALRSPVIGDEPIVLVGKAFTPGTSGVVADTLLGWGGTGWRYFVRDKAERDTALDWIDDSWTGYFGNRYSRPCASTTPRQPRPERLRPPARGLALYRAGGPDAGLARLLRQVGVGRRGRPHPQAERQGRVAGPADQHPHRRPGQARRGQGRHHRHDRRAQPDRRGRRLLLSRHPVPAWQEPGHYLSQLIGPN